MKRAYIFGAGGHANVIASIIYGRYGEVNFVDRALGASHVINERDFFDNLESYGGGDNQIRMRVYEQLIKHQITPASCVAELSFVAHDAVLGDGVVICPGSVVGSRARIGDNTIINTLSSVDHDCVLGEHSQVAAGVTFGGNTKVGRNCLLGIKSATIPGISIGDNSLIMAGSIVYKDIPSNVLAGGNPATVVKRL